MTCLLCRCILCCTAAHMMEETSHTAPVPPLVPVPVPDTAFALLPADNTCVTVEEELGMVVWLEHGSNQPIEPSTMNVDMCHSVAGCLERSIPLLSDRSSAFYVCEVFVVGPTSL